MATTTRDIRAIGARPKALPRPKVIPAGLPRDVCADCEQANFACFRAGAEDDPAIWQSPERLARDDSGDEQPREFVCRLCGRHIRRPDEAGRDVVGQVGQAE